MAPVVMALSVSLDGVFEGVDGDLSWHQVDDELHQWFNDSLRGCAAFLEGRREWELMHGFWPTADRLPGAGAPEREFAGIWRGMRKVVYSRTLADVDGDPRAELRREVDPREVRAWAQEGPLSVGGPTLGAAFLEKGLLDELHLYVTPVVVGEGRRLFDVLGSPSGLRLIDSRVFGNGVVLVRYATS